MIFIRVVGEYRIFGNCYYVLYDESFDFLGEFLVYFEYFKKVNSYILIYFKYIEFNKDVIFV